MAFLCVSLNLNFSLRIQKTVYDDKSELRKVCNNPFSHFQQDEMLLLLHLLFFAVQMTLIPFFVYYCSAIKKEDFVHFFSSFSVGSRSSALC